MTRIALRALAFACVLPLLAACNLTASQAEITTSLNPNLITSAVLTPANLAKLGFTPAQAIAFEAKVAAGVKTGCKYQVTEATVAQILVALAAGSTAGVTAGQAVTTLCTVLGAPASAYTADKPVTEPPAEKDDTPVGETKTRTVVINGKTVTITGTKTK